MGRKRLKPDGVAYHHVMVRCAQGCYWLEEPWAKDIFVDLIDFYQKVYYVNILGYVVMSNHVHICLEMNRPEFDLEDIRLRYELAQQRIVNKRCFHEGRALNLYKRYADLSWFMWEVNRRMSLAYNKAMGTKGHLWSGRFKNVVVESGQNLLNVLAYIELNPVRAGMIDDPTHFAYCSSGRIKQELDEGLEPDAPKIKALESVPQKQRAASYVDWIRFLAFAEKDPEIKASGMPLNFTSLGWQVDMEKVYEALDSRSPSRWSHQIYGSKTFEKQILIDAGWLVELAPKKEPPDIQNISSAA